MQKVVFYVWVHSRLHFLKRFVEPSGQDQHVDEHGAGDNRERISANRVFGLPDCLSVPTERGKQQGKVNPSKRVTRIQS